jgi:hypothetical protein
VIACGTAVRKNGRFLEPLVRLGAGLEPLVHRLIEYFDHTENDPVTAVRPGQAAQDGIG